MGTAVGATGMTARASGRILRMRFYGNLTQADRRAGSGISQMQVGCRGFRRRRLDTCGNALLGQDPDDEMAPAAQRALIIKKQGDRHEDRPGLAIVRSRRNSPRSPSRPYRLAGTCRRHGGVPMVGLAGMLRPSGAATAWLAGGRVVRRASGRAAPRSPEGAVEMPSETDLPGGARSWLTPEQAQAVEAGRAGGRTLRSSLAGRSKAPQTEEQGAARNPLSSTSRDDRGNTWLVADGPAVMLARTEGRTGAAAGSLLAASRRNRAAEASAWLHWSRRSATAAPAWSCHPAVVAAGELHQPVSGSPATMSRGGLPGRPARSAVRRSRNRFSPGCALCSPRRAEEDSNPPEAPRSNLFQSGAAPGTRAEGQARKVMIVVRPSGRTRMGPAGPRLAQHPRADARPASEGGVLRRSRSGRRNSSASITSLGLARNLGPGRPVQCARTRMACARPR